MNVHSKAKPAVTTGSLPASRKIHAVPDAAPDIRVPLREIQLSEGAGEPNLPVYDTSGPYTDPNVIIDVNAGLPRPRTAWVKERGGVEEYDGRNIKPEDNGNVSAVACRDRLQGVPQAAARRRRRADHAARIRARGIITKEMIYVAQRENLGRKQRSIAPRPLWPMAKASAPRFPSTSRRNSCATRSRAAARSFPATSIMPSWSR